MRKVMEDKNGRRFFVGQRVIGYSHGHNVDCIIKSFRVKQGEAEVQILGKKYNFYLPLIELEFCSIRREFKDNQ